MKAQKDLYVHRTQSECTAAEANEEPSEYRLTCDLRRKDLEWLRPLLDGAGFSYSISRSLKNVPNEVQPLFRFELFFDGTYQGVGFLQGLDDMCEPAAYRRLMKPFKDSLPVPMNLDQPSSFWFTEKGLQKFGDAIDEINRYASGTGWDIRCMVLWVHEMNYIYQDEYQIALGPEFIDPDGFAPFSHASELMNFEPEQAAKVITPPNKGRDHSHHWDGRGTFI